MPKLGMFLQFLLCLRSVLRFLVIFRKQFPRKSKTSVHWNRQDTWMWLATSNVILHSAASCLLRHTTTTKASKSCLWLTRMMRVICRRWDEEDRNVEANYSLHWSMLEFRECYGFDLLSRIVSHTQLLHPAIAIHPFIVRFASPLYRL